MDRNQRVESAEARRKGSRLPNLRRRVEYFHLISGREADVFHVEVVGTIPDEALIDRKAKKEIGPFMVGMIYEARLFAGSRSFKFSTQLLKESPGPLGCYFFEYPGVVSHMIVRRDHWVRTRYDGST